jgi:replicative DNA helicase
MNTEAELISAVCKNKDINVLLADNVDDLFFSHKDVWNGLKSYYYKYKAVPDAGVLQDKFRDFDSVSTSGETGYYLDKLKSEYLSNKIKTILLNTGSALKEEAPSRILQKMQIELANLNKFTSNVRDLDVTDIKSAENYYRNLRERSLAMGGSPGIPTGFKAIDAAYPTGMAPGHLITVIGWPGRGKRIDVNSKIATPSGWRRYGDISIGDEVIGSNGRPCNVTGVYNKDMAKAYEVKFNDGTSVIADPDHLWSIYLGQRGKKRDNLVTMTTQEILDRGLFRSRVGHKEYKAILPFVQPVQYSKIDLPVDPYTLGAIIGDGSYREGSHQVVITCNDQEIPELIKKNNSQFVVSEIKSSSVRRWSIKGGLYQILKENSLLAVRSDKFIPDNYLISSHEDRLALLRGLMDTDGYCTKNAKYAQFSQKNKKLSIQVAELVRSLGGFAKISESKTRSGEFTVYLWIPENPFMLKRKAEKWSPKNKPFKAFESITPHEDTEMMCISVDAEDSLYVIQDYTVTHNTWMTAYLACKAWEQGFKPMIVSLEMSPENMRDRIYTMLGSGIFRASSLSRGEINLDDFNVWANRSFADKRGFVLVSNEGVGDVTPATVQGKIDQHRPDMVILDYHQLFNDNKKSQSEVERNRNISREFKLLAVNNSIPVLDITAATADKVSDQDDPPMMSQVAWSKAIEYDADMAMAVHRHPDTNLIEVVSRKNRHGSNFAFYLDWDIDRGIIKELYDTP